MSATDEIRSRLRDIIGQVLGTPTEIIGPGFSVESTPQWTSLNHLMLISQIEREFKVFFSSREVQQLTSFERIVSALTGRTEPGN
jgi:acyl carrier protein